MTPEQFFIALIVVGGILLSLAALAEAVGFAQFTDKFDMEIVFTHSTKYTQYACIDITYVGWFFKHAVRSSFVRRHGTEWYCIDDCPYATVVTEDQAYLNEYFIYTPQPYPRKEYI